MTVLNRRLISFSTAHIRFISPFLPLVSSVAAAKAVWLIFLCFFWTVIMLVAKINPLLPIYTIAILARQDLFQPHMSISSL